MKRRTWEMIGAMAGGVALVAAVVKAVRSHCRSDYDDEGYGDYDFDEHCPRDYPEDDLDGEDAETDEFEDSLHQTVMAHYDKGFRDGILLEYNGDNPAAQALAHSLQCAIDSVPLAGVVVQPMSENAKTAFEEIAKSLMAMTKISPSNKDETANSDEGSEEKPTEVESSAGTDEVPEEDPVKVEESAAEDTERRYGCDV